MSEDRPSTGKARVGKMLDKMSEFRTFIEGLNRTIRGKLVLVAGLVNAQWVLLRAFITAAHSGNEGTVCCAICNLCEYFLAKASYYAFSSSAGGLSDQT